MTIRIRFSPTAERDLKHIEDWLARERDRPFAEAYVDRIVDHCESLRDFPNRGSPHGRVPGTRSIVHERRATVIYRVDRNRVTILGIFHAGRDPTR